MLRRIVSKLLERHYFWRFAGFNELSELYTSMMLRSMGLSLVGIFVPIYLYKLDYTLLAIFFFMAGICASRMIFNPLAGQLVAYAGPKHVMLVSFVTQIIALAMLLTLPSLQWPLWLIAVVSGAALSLFFIAYHVDFSKVMHADHGGKELGFMTVLERLGGALGPVLGGVVASAFGAQYTIGMALFFLILAVIPLFMTAEPTRTRQKLSFRELPYGRLKRDFFVFTMLGVDNQVSMVLWPLYLAVVLFTVNTYATVGLVTSIGIIAAILAARFIGQLIDRHRGGLLLRWSAAGGALLHLFRPFIGTLSGVVLMNMAHDGVATGYRLALLKGMYARADELPGFRIVYIVWVETISDVGKTIFWLLAAAAIFIVGQEGAMEVGFILGAIASLLLMVQRFPGLRSRQFL